MYLETNYVATRRNINTNYLMLINLVRVLLVNSNIAYFKIESNCLSIEDLYKSPLYKHEYLLVFLHYTILLSFPL
jgi:hypothetical protein